MTRNDLPKYRPNLYELQSQSQKTFSDGVTVCLLVLLLWLTIGTVVTGILAFANLDPVTSTILVFTHIGLGFVGYDWGLKYYLGKAKKILDSYECKPRH